MGRHGLDLSGSGYGQMAGACESIVSLRGNFVTEDLLASKEGPTSTKWLHDQV
jgi:hypothetical protein